MTIRYCALVSVKVKFYAFVTEMLQKILVSFVCS